jgi:enoyl-CoA hydratase/carnithine racemase
MSYQHILFDQTDDVALITLNRPQVRNSLSMVMSDELIDAFWKVRRSTEIKTIDFKAKGELWEKRRGLAKRFWVE